MKHSAQAACAALLVLAAACSVGTKTEPPPVSAKKFAVPLFDGLWLGMSRDDAARAHPMRPTLTSAGKNRRVWVYDRSGEYSVELTFADGGPTAKLERFDVHFGANEIASQRVIGDLARRLGEPEVPRRKALTNAYGDHLHDQYDTVWSDADQYVYVVERIPIEGRGGRTDRFISVKRKQIGPTGPPTGYVPPPPPKDKDGKPVEEEPF
jgi:hypothetical protein